ncbi:MAG: hypothetical protein AAFV95_22910 [Bacteroidota bacterium]
MAHPNLPLEIVRYFGKRNVRIDLDKGPDGKLSPAYASFQKLKKGKRGFWAESTFSYNWSGKENDFTTFPEENAFVLFLAEDQQFLARMATKNMELIPPFVFDWLQEKKELQELDPSEEHLTLFVPFEHPDVERIKPWNKIKNHMVFIQPNFFEFKKKQWQKDYAKMLQAMHQNDYLFQYTPYTSHYRLILNNESQTLPTIYILPTAERGFTVAQEANSRLGEKPFFESESFFDIDEAVGFYAEMLAWGKKKQA